MTTRYLHQTHLLFAKMCLKEYSDAKKEQKEKKKKRKGKLERKTRKEKDDVLLFTRNLAKMFFLK